MIIWNSLGASPKSSKKSSQATQSWKAHQCNESHSHSAWGGLRQHRHRESQKQLRQPQVLATTWRWLRGSCWQFFFASKQRYPQLRGHSQTSGTNFGITDFDYGNSFLTTGMKKPSENETFWSKLSTWPSFDLVSNQNGKYFWVFNTLTQLKMKSLDWEFDIIIITIDWNPSMGELVVLPGSLLHGKFGSRDGGDPYLWLFCEVILLME